MLLLLVCALGLVGGCLGNRAFPLASENYVIKLFQTVNPNIRYDETNFLVDLSGRYIVCSRVGERGNMAISERLEDGRSIYGLVDYGFGAAMHVDAVNGYIRETLDSWVADPEFYGTIRGSQVFGCSVRPGCGDNYVVGCAFNGQGGGNLENTTPGQGDRPDYEQHTVAFTPQQYDLAELVSGIRWDRSHYLENLSGFETQCAMMTQEDWDWPLSRELASAEGLRVSGMMGYAVNHGETEPALLEVIEQFQAEITKVQPSQIGCSLIADCISHRQMYVVVGCLYVA